MSSFSTQTIWQPYALHSICLNFSWPAVSALHPLKSGTISLQLPECVSLLIHFIVISWPTISSQPLNSLYTFFILLSIVRVYKLCLLSGILHYCCIVYNAGTVPSVLVPSVLWCCWLGGRKGIQPVKNWVVGCLHGYRSGARCRLTYAQLMPLPLTVSCFSTV